MPKSPLPPLTSEQIDNRAAELLDAYRRINRQDPENELAMQRLIITGYNSLLKEITYRMDDQPI